MKDGRSLKGVFYGWFRSPGGIRHKYVHHGLPLDKKQACGVTESFSGFVDAFMPQPKLIFGLNEYKYEKDRV